MRMSLPPTFGQEDSLARTSQLRAWGRELGLKGKNLDSFLSLLDYLKETVPEFSSSRTFQACSLPTAAETSKSLFERWPTSGMAWGGVCLTARYFGVPQSRQRVYVVACHRDGRGPAEILFEPERRKGDAAKGQSNGKAALSPFKTSFGDPVQGPIVPGIAYCLYACSARHTGTDWSRTYVTYPAGKIRRLLPIECERVQDFPDNWTLVPENNGYGDPDKVDTLRYNALGNAVSVAVAEWLAGRIKRYLTRANKAASNGPRGRVKKRVSRAVAS